MPGIRLQVSFTFILELSSNGRGPSWKAVSQEGQVEGGHGMPCCDCHKMTSAPGKGSNSSPILSPLTIQAHVSKQLESSPGPGRPAVPMEAEPRGYVRCPLAPLQCISAIKKRPR